jgi:hypothetical protein
VTRLTKQRTAQAVDEVMSAAQAISASLEA